MEPRARASETGSGPYPVATLDVTITHPDADDITYTISCLGDTATIVGTYDGAAIGTTVDRSNGCGIDDWDRQFAGIVPTALGITQGT